jgi:hypothetical protein
MGPSARVGGFIWVLPSRKKFGTGTPARIRSWNQRQKLSAHQRGLRMTSLVEIRDRSEASLRRGVGLKVRLMSLSRAGVSATVLSRVVRARAMGFELRSALILKRLVHAFEFNW